MGLQNDRNGMKSTPKLATLFRVNDQLLVDNCPVEEGEDEAGFKNHPGSHEQYWDQLLKNGEVSECSEYEPYPRGRVMYDNTTKNFSSFPDRCILNKPGVVDRIKTKPRLHPEPMGLLTRTNVVRNACETRRHTVRANRSELHRWRVLNWDHKAQPQNWKKFRTWLNALTIR
jgi:hypothetical protein